MLLVTWWFAMNDKTWFGLSKSAFLLSRFRNLFTFRIVYWLFPSFSSLRRMFIIAGVGSLCIA